MSSTITTHRSGIGLNERLTIHAGTSNAGNAPTLYAIDNQIGEGAAIHVAALAFPPGGGITNEALLAIVVDRLEKFQEGPFSCHENAYALRSLHSALEWLHKRTQARADRGVEGKQEA